MKTLLALLTISFLATGGAIADDAKPAASVTGNYKGHVKGAEGDVRMALLQEGDLVHGRIHAQVDGKGIRGLILGRREKDRVILWILAGDDLVFDFRLVGDNLNGHFIDGWPDENKDGILTFEEARAHFDKEKTRQLLEEVEYSKVNFTRERNE